MKETLSGFCGKVVHVAPLYEVDDKLLVDSLLPVWSNVMDSVMEKQLSAYLDQLNTWLLSKFCQVILNYFSCAIDSSFC